MQYTPQDLKQVMSTGLLSFPVTDFDANGDFNAASYAARLEWLAPYGASALFAAGGLIGVFISGRRRGGCARLPGRLRCLLRAARQCGQRRKKRQRGHDN